MKIKGFWVEFFPINPATGLPVRVRVCSINSATATGIDLSNGEFMPYMTTFPDTEIAVFDGAFSGESSVSISNIEASDVDGFAANFPSYVWDGTDVIVYKGDSNSSSMASLQKVFSGVCTETPEINEGEVSWTMKDKLYLFDVSILTETYSGEGGINGTSEMTGVYKPFAMGEPLNIEPILVDPAYLIYQYHGYGPTEGVVGLYENGLGFGAGQTPVAYNSNPEATFQDLRNADLEPGEWVDCPSIGMFRLGGEPVSGGVITADVRGHAPSVGGSAYTRIDDCIELLVSLSGVDSSLIDANSFDGLYSGSGNQTLSDYTNSSSSLLEVVTSYMAQCGGYPFINSEGHLRFGFVRLSTPALEIRTDGTSSPSVESAISMAVSAPYKRLRMGGDKVFRVHNYDEISDALRQSVMAVANALNTVTTDFYLAVNDGNLTIQEKIQVVIPDDTAFAFQYASLRARALVLGLSVTALDAAQSAYVTSRNLITPAWDDTTQNSTGIPSDFRAKMAAFGNALITMSTSISQEDAKRSNWSGVTNDNGNRPDDNADVTGDNTAAAIFLQGALATQDTADWRTQVLARPAINELYYDFNYPSWGGVGGAAAAGWQGDPAGQFSIVDVPNSPGGKALVMGDGTTSTNTLVFGPEFVPYNAGDLYEVSFDIEIISAPDAGTTYYLGVQGVDKAGNNLGGSYNYVGASDLSQNAAVGTRFIKKGYFTGWTTSNRSGQANDPLSPAGLPDGSYFTYGQGGVVKFRPVIYMNYAGKRGQTRVHAVRVVRIPARLATQDEVSFGAVTLKESAGGSTATLTNFKTSLGTAAAILSQGALATLNDVDWQSKVVGVGKPSNGAGTANVLVAIGTGTVLQGNTAGKTSGTHGAYEGGAVGVAQKSTAFISSSVLFDTNGAGGWLTVLCLDITNSSGFGGGGDGSWILVYTASATNSATISLQKRVSGSFTIVGSWTVTGGSTASRRIAIANNGVRVFAMCDGAVYGGDTSSYNVPADATFWPKLLDYYRSDGSVTGGVLDIQYGKWTDVRTFLGDGVTAIAQAAYKTDEGTAAAITGQGALATQNNVDLGTSQVVPNGGIPPTIPDNGFTYTSTNSSVTITWPTMTVYRANGSTISIASGSQSCTVLSASYNWKFYPYIVDNGGSSATIQFAAAQGALGTYYGYPSIAYATPGSVAAKTYVNQIGRIDMGSFNAATTSGGTGGGGGGGWNCLHGDMLLRNGRAIEAEVGDTVDTPEGTSIITDVRRWPCSEWIELWNGDDIIAKVTRRHLFYKSIDGKEIAAEDVRVGDLICGRDSHVEVTGIKLCTLPSTAVGIGIDSPHQHYAGQRRVLCHNGTQKP